MDIGNSPIFRRQKVLKIHSCYGARAGQGGRIKLAGLLVVMVLVVSGYTAYKFAPPVVNYYRLKTAAGQIAEYGAAGVLPQSRYSSGSSMGEIAAIEEAVLREARELDIPLTKGDIKVEKETNKVSITVRYVVPIQLPDRVYNLTLSFTEHN